MLQSQSATGTHLGFIAFGQSDEKPRLYQLALQRTEHHGGIKIGTQIHSGTLWSSVGGQLLMALIYNLYLYHIFF
jgi:hypothetical protein